jgi:4-hydroxy-tetrahydrodipicolinate synthase
MVKHHVRLGVKGLFIAGTCGEGAFLPQREIRNLTSKTVEASGGRLVVAVQVTDNSFSRVLERAKDAKADGADIAVIAEPHFLRMQETNPALKRYYFESVEKSPLPVGLYIRPVLFPLKTYRQLFTHPNVRLLKDSSLNRPLMRVCASVSKRRKDLAALTGYEFGIPAYLKAGYDGALAGGGILIGGLIGDMLEAARARRFDRADAIQKRCSRILHTTYGGKKITSWLAGLKYALVRMGIFRTAASYLEYPLPARVRKNIERMIEREREALLP